MIRPCLLAVFFSLAAIHLAPAHGVEAGNPAMDDEVLRAHILAEWEQARVASKRKPGAITPVRVAALSSTLNLAAAVVAQTQNAPVQSRAFQAFPKLDIKWDKDFLFIGSNGLPDHRMMVGITAWQQQVPLPQAYFGSNAWRIPLHPVPAQEPALIKGRFLRGAIALAANGIPIFNPQNNRGEVSQEIGELDQWGGHCGRADDYHYHAAPLHLQAIVGKGLPIAYALDGYPIYGLTEPDGSPVGKLDVCQGHETTTLGYHYHASTKYPYVMGGFHGVVTEAEGQVDPQPRASPVRPDTPPLRGAEITDFESTGTDSYRLSYTVAGEKRSVSYTIKADGTYPFEYNNGKEGLMKEVYTARAGGRGQGGEPRPNRRQGERPPMRGERPAAREKSTQTQKAASTSTRGFVLTSSAVEEGGSLPADFTGDGSGATLPLAWTGAPAGTTSYALIMDHEAPGNEMKGYWTMWDIPATVTSLPKNVQGVGELGTGFRGKVGYEPPHSKGPGEKTYVLHVYALSAAPQIREPASQVNREVLLAAIKDKILATADLHVVYARQSSVMEGRGEDPPPPPPAPRERPNRKGDN